MRYDTVPIQCVQFVHIESQLNRFQQNGARENNRCFALFANVRVQRAFLWQNGCKKISSRNVSRRYRQAGRRWWGGENKEKKTVRLEIGCGFKRSRKTLRVANTIVVKARDIVKKKIRFLYRNFFVSFSYFLPPSAMVQGNVSGQEFFGVIVCNYYKFTIP